MSINKIINASIQKADPSNSFKITYETRIGAETHIQELDVAGALICFIPKGDEKTMGTAGVGVADAIAVIAANVGQVGEKVLDQIEKMVREEMAKEQKK